MEISSFSNFRQYKKLLTETQRYFIKDNLVLINKIDFHPGFKYNYLTSFVLRLKINPIEIEIITKPARNTIQLKCSGTY